MKTLTLLIVSLLTVSPAFGQRVQVIKLAPTAGQTNTSVQLPPLPSPTNQVVTAQTNTVPAIVPPMITPDAPVRIIQETTLPTAPASKASGPNKFWSRVGGFVTGGRSADETLGYGFLGGQGVATSRFKNIPREIRERESSGTHQSDHYGFYGESHSRGSHYTYDRVNRPVLGGLPEYVAPTSYLRVESYSSRTFPSHRPQPSGSSSRTVKIWGK